MYKKEIHKASFSLHLTINLKGVFDISNNECSKKSENCLATKDWLLLGWAMNLPQNTMKKKDFLILVKKKKKKITCGKLD